MDWFTGIFGYCFISLCFTVSHYRMSDLDTLDLVLSIFKGLCWPFTLGSRLIDKILGFDDQMSDLSMVILILLLGAMYFFSRIV